MAGSASLHEDRIEVNDFCAAGSDVREASADALKNESAASDESRAD